MIKVFFQSLRLNITCRVNAILYWIKHIPVLRNLFRGVQYDDVGWLKQIVFIVAVIWEIATFFLGKVLYLVAFVLPYFALFNALEIETKGISLFAHIVFLLSIIGAFTRNTLFEAGTAEYYAIFLMRMDAKKRALSSYFYFLFKTGFGFFVTYLVIYFLFDVDLTFPMVIMLSLLPVAIKICFAAWDLRSRSTRGTRRDLKNDIWMYVPIILLLLAAYGLPFFGVTMPVWLMYVITLIVILGSVPSVRALYLSENYRLCYQRELARNEAIAQKVGVNQVNVTTAESFQKKIVLDVGDVEGSKGCHYLNRLFFRRHKKLMMRPALRMGVIVSTIFILAVIGCIFSTELSEGVNESLIDTLPFFLLIMYFMNRGETTTKIFFFNCDHSLLQYRFYRQPKVLLSLFTQRLMTMIKINLIPGAIIAFGLPLLQWITGGANEKWLYPLMMISILSMSVFFSVHYLVLYYLFQPFTEGLESKNPIYKIITAVTYAVSYFCTQIRFSPIPFGIVLIGFTVLYILIALLVVYRLAPRTFRIRY